MFFIAKRLAAMFGWDLQRTQRVLVWIAVIIAASVFIVIFGLIYRACNKPPKLDQQQIIKAQQAIAKEDRKEMIEVLAQSDAKEKVADDTAANAEQTKNEAIVESKKKWSEASNDEMAAELERRANQ